MDKLCPRCRLWNSSVAQVCDCGYNFSKSKIEESTISKIKSKYSIETINELFEKYKLINNCLIPYGYILTPNRDFDKIDILSHFTIKLVKNENKITPKIQLLLDPRILFEIVMILWFTYKYLELKSNNIESLLMLIVSLFLLIGILGYIRIFLYKWRETKKIKKILEENGLMN